MMNGRHHACNLRDLPHRVPGSSKPYRQASLSNGGPFAHPPSIRGAAAAPHSDPPQVIIHFMDSDVMTSAEPGEGLLEVAARAGIPVQLGCCRGSCGVCEVRWWFSHAGTRSILKGNWAPGNGSKPNIDLFDSTGRGEMPQNQQL